MIEVQVTRVVAYNNDLIVLLQAGEGERALPIHVDYGQAHAIELQLEGLSFPRPLTHDLFKNVIAELGAELARAEVCDLVDSTFYARLVLAIDGRELQVDARPSDAIALALRCDASILVEEEIMEKASIPIQSEQHAVRKKPTPQQLLERKLAKAIEQERYEDAAKYRDQIKQMKEPKRSN